MAFKNMCRFYLPEPPVALVVEAQKLTALIQYREVKWVANPGWLRNPELR